MGTVFILFISLFITLVLTELSVEVFPLEYNYFDQKIRELVFVADFDENEDLYLSPDAAYLFSQTGAVTFTRCCSPTVTSDCLESDDYKCIDDNEKIITIPVDQDIGFAIEEYIFHFDVSFPGSIFVEVEPLQGDVLINIKYQNSETWFLEEDRRRSFIIDTGRYLGLRSLPSSMRFTAFHETEAIVRIKIHTTPSLELPLHAWSHLLTIDLSSDVFAIKCPGFFGNTRINYQNIPDPFYCKYNYLPTDSPVVDYFSSFVSKEQKPWLKNRFVFSIVANLIDYKNNDVSEIFNFDLTQEITVRLSYIVDENLVPAYTASSIATVVENDCEFNQLDQQSVVDQFSQISEIPINFVENTFGLDTYLINTIFETYLEKKLDIVLGSVLTPNFVACSQYLRNSILDSTFQQFDSTEENGCIWYSWDPEYALNPCCNKSLTQNVCCLPAPTTRLLIASKVNETSLPEKCSSDYLFCAQNILEQYLVATNSRCSYIDNIVTLNEIDTDQIYQKCQDQLFGKTCRTNIDCHTTFGFQSLCLDVPDLTFRSLGKYKVCTIPCETDSDCLYSSCQGSGSWKICGKHEHYSQNVDDISRRITQCVLETLQSEDIFFIREFYRNFNLPLKTSIEVATSQLTSELEGDRTCVPALTATSTTNCENMTSCNWFPCVEGEYKCNSDPTSCDSGAYFCGKQSSYNPFIYQDVSQKGECVIHTHSILRFSISASICSKTGYFHSEFGTCKTENEILEDCFDPIPCSYGLIDVSDLHLNSAISGYPEGTTGTLCPPLCYSTVVNSSECVKYGHTYTTDYAVPLCIGELSLGGECRVLPPGSGSNVLFEFWLGATFFPEEKNVEEECTPYCRSDETALTKEDCTLGYHCTNSFCEDCDEEECENSGYCNVRQGCYIPYDANGECILFSTTNWWSVFAPLVQARRMEWTPQGCLFTLSHGAIISELTCINYFGGSWISVDDWQQTTKEECDSMYGYCQTTIQRYITEKPKMNNKLNQTECEKCGNTWKSSYWIPGEWVQNNDEWFDVAWMQRGMTQLYEEYTTISLELLRSDILFSRMSRITTVLAGGMQCEYGDLLNIVATGNCYCTEGQTCGVCSEDSNVVSSVFEAFNACSGIASNFTNPTFGTIFVSSDFVLPNETCVDLLIYQIRSRSFEFPVKDVPSARNFYTQYNREVYSLLTSENGVIYGAVVGDAFGIYLGNSIPDEAIDEISVCINIPTGWVNETIKNMLFSSIDVAIVSRSSDTTLSTIENFLKLNITLDQQQVCFPLIPDSFYLFVAFDDDLRETTYLETLGKDGEYLIPGMIGYGILWGFGVIFFFVKTFSVEGVKNKTKFCDATTLVMIIGAVTTRFCHLLIIYNDLEEGYQQYTVLYIETPSLLFLLAFTISILRWTILNKFQTDEFFHKGPCADFCFPILTPIWASLGFIYCFFFWICYMIVTLAKERASVSATVNSLSYGFVISYIIFGIMTVLIFSCTTGCAEEKKKDRKGKENDKKHCCQCSPYTSEFFLNLLVSFGILAHAFLLYHTADWQGGWIWTLGDHLSYTFILDLICFLGAIFLLSPLFSYSVSSFSVPNKNYDPKIN